MHVHVMYNSFIRITYTGCIEVDGKKVSKHDVIVHIEGSSY